MSQIPTRYTRATNFTTDALFNPIPSPTSLDTELNRIKDTTDQTINRLNEVQRDDGKLKNGVVTIDSLSPEVIAYIQSLANG